MADREFIAAKDLPVTEVEEVNVLVVDPATGALSQKSASGFGGGGYDAILEYDGECKWIKGNAQIISDILFAGNISTNEDIENTRITGFPNVLIIHSAWGRVEAYPVTCYQINSIYEISMSSRLIPDTEYIINLQDGTVSENYFG